MDRQSEIELKRARLAELRKHRQERTSSLQRPQTASPARRTPSTSLVTGEYIANTKFKQIPPGASVGDYVDSLLLNRDTDSLDSKLVTSEGSQRSSEAPSSLNEECLTTSIGALFEVQNRKEIVSYSKSVQTESLEDEVGSGHEEQVDADELRAQIRQELQQELHDIDSKIQGSEPTKESQRIPIMDEGETKKLVDDVSFQKFIGSSWRILGRALEEDYNILIDYGNEGKEEDSVDNAREIASFFSSQSDGRAITGIDWSHKFPELIASSHTQKHNDPTAQKGLVQIWNLRGSKKSAEYVFNAQSDILSVKFSQYDQRLLYGTAYNGQVFAWDIRSGSYPVLKSPVAGVGHLYPVYSMELTGTQNASTLITASTDGEICTWSTDVLAKPQDKLNLVVTTKHSSGTRRDEESSATALALSHLDASQFHVGTEAGCIYQCSRFAQASLRAGVDNRGLYMGHRAPVTSLSVHPSSGSISLGQYMLSSSTDWSIKLWRIKQFSQLGGSSSKSNTSEFVAPIADISRDDAVYDVAWSPLLPGVFADVDGSGYLDIWNICRDMDFPIFRLKPSNSSTSKPSSGSINRPLNRLSWSRHDPHKVATGGLDGIVSVFQLDPQFLPTQEAEFWVQAKRNLLTLEEQTV